MASASTLEVRPRAPRGLVPAAGVGGGLAWLVLAVADLPGAARATLATVLAVACVALARRFRRDGEPLRREPDGTWRLTRTGAPATLDPATRVHRDVVVLVLRTPRRHTSWIPRSSLDAATFRRLKAHLRLARPAAGPVPEKPSRPAC